VSIKDAEQHVNFIYEQGLNPPYLSAVKIPYGEMIAAALAEVEAGNGKVLAHNVLSFSGTIVPGSTAAPRSEAGKSVKGELAAASIL